MRALPSCLLLTVALSCGGPDEWEEEVDFGELEQEATSTTITPANNRDAIPGIVRVIDAARTRLDVVQYVYLFDRTGTRPVTDALRRAVARGVKVKVLLDDEPADNAAAKAELARLGAEVKLDSATKVTHNKFFLADAKLFFTGSANVSSESLQENNEVNVVVSSTSLGAKLRTYFDTIWANPAGTATIAATARSTTRLLADAQYGPSALAAIKAARTRVRLVMYATRYGANRVPPLRDQLVDALREAKARGVEVKVILERSSSAWDRTTYQENRNTASRLRAGGVDVRFDSETVRTHAKLLVTDNVVHLGSTNWTSAALEDYHATDLRFSSATNATKFASYFDTIWTASRP